MNQPDGFDCPGCAWPEPRRATARRSSSARTARRRSPRRRRRARADAAFFARARVAELRGRRRPLARPAGPPDPADGAARGGHALPADRVGRRVRAHRRGAIAALDVAGRGGLLHVRAHQQRGGVPLPAVRARVRHQQPARLLEHVPRVERRRARSRRSASARARFSSRTSSTPTLIFDHRAEPGHQPPAHADHAAGGRAPRLPDRRINPLPEVGAGALRAPAAPARGCSAAARRSPALYLPVRIGGDVALLKG